MTDKTIVLNREKGQIINKIFDHLVKGGRVQLAREFRAECLYVEDVNEVMKIAQRYLNLDEKTDPCHGDITLLKVES